MGDIQIGRISRLLTKWSVLKGPLGNISMGSEIVPMLQIWSGVENRYLESWNRYGTALLISGAASNQSVCQFRNPSGSKVMAVFEKLLVGSPAAAGNTIVASNGVIATDLGTVVVLTAARLDARGSSNPSLSISQQNSSAAPGDLPNALARVFVGQAAGVLPIEDLILTDNQEIPLLPGDGLRIRIANLNTELDVSVLWRERALEDSEQA
jgi:hypothetical protein